MMTEFQYDLLKDVAVGVGILFFCATMLACCAFALWRIAFRKDS
jgi:hypothetical protein